jgi:hypothetical protein
MPMRPEITGKAVPHPARQRVWRQWS